MIELKAVGKIRTTYGVHGELKFFSYSGEYEHFQKMKNLILRNGKVEKIIEIEAIRWSGEQPLLKIKGIDQPEEAKKYADFEIWVNRDEAAPLAEGEYYLSDLIGCDLVFEGKKVGAITGYLEGGSTELLEIRKTNGQSAVVPFMNMYLGDIDLSGKSIELKTLWILE